MSDVPMDSEALKPASLSLLDKIKSPPKPETGEPIKPEVLGGPQPKRRGRPPGSRNKPSLSDEERLKQEAEARKKAKEAKAKAYTEKIVTDVNEQLMELFMGLGVPSNMLYKEGHAPIRYVDSKYTDLGNALAVKPGQAKAVASFVAEMETTGAGSKVAETLTDSTLSTIIKGGMAAFAIYQYAKGISQLYTQLQPLIEAHKEYQRQQAEQAERAKNG